MQFIYVVVQWLVMLVHVSRRVVPQTLYILRGKRNKTVNDVKYYVEGSTCRTTCGLVM
jgi:hypothetical protein